MGKLNKGGLVGGFDQLRAPDAPTIGAATAGNEEVAVAFTAASNAGAGTVSSFAVTGVASGVSTGATGTYSPITVTGLTNGTDVTFSVIAISEFGASPSSGTVVAAATSLNSRALFGGAYPNSNVIQQIEIPTTGNATDFGDLSAERNQGTATSSNTRGVFMGGYLNTGGGAQDTMEYVTIASAGNATDFGDLSAARRSTAPISNDTRGIICGGDTSANDTAPVNIMEYITIASTGNTTDFGNLDRTLMEVSCGGSTTRGLIMGGHSGNLNNLQQDVHYITIAAAGDVTDFGNLSATRAKASNGPVSSNTRCIIGGAVTNNSYTTTNIIEYFTTASTGDATDFGDLTDARRALAAASSHVRGVFAGGNSAGPNVNIIDYITIGTAGNASDYGDLVAEVQQLMGTSGAHGGLS